MEYYMMWSDTRANVMTITAQDSQSIALFCNILWDREGGTLLIVMYIFVFFFFYLSPFVWQSMITVSLYSFCLARGCSRVAIPIQQGWRRPGHPKLSQGLPPLPGQLADLAGFVAHPLVAGIVADTPQTPRRTDLSPVAEIEVSLPGRTTGLCPVTTPYATGRLCPGPDHQRSVECPVGEGGEAPCPWLFRLCPRLLRSAVGEAASGDLLRGLQFPQCQAARVRHDWRQAGNGHQGNESPTHSTTRRLNCL